VMQAFWWYRGKNPKDKGFRRDHGPAVALAASGPTYRHLKFRASVPPCARPAPVVLTESPSSLAWKLDAQAINSLFLSAVASRCRSVARLNKPLLSDKPNVRSPSVKRQPVTATSSTGALASFRAMILAISR
jgi:hypothetical protein